MLHNLWPRRPTRHYALLDSQGHCLGLWQLCEPPRGQAWVEVNASDPRWIGQPLPATARLHGASNDCRGFQRAPAASRAAM